MKKNLLITLLIASMASMYAQTQQPSYADQIKAALARAVDYTKQTTASVSDWFSRKWHDTKKQYQTHKDEQLKAAKCPVNAQKTAEPSQREESK